LQWREVHEAKFDLNLLVHDLKTDVKKAAMPWDFSGCITERELNKHVIFLLLRRTVPLSTMIGINPLLIDFETWS
jgi:hypothetical protein